MMTKIEHMKAELEYAAALVDAIATDCTEVRDRVLYETRGGQRSAEGDAYAVKHRKALRTLVKAVEDLAHVSDEEV